ncbi:hypothetical protein RB614_43675 [Phytohabitans sp. ZYX-F-186]|uniref:Histidine kinase n=1 Tax=Phytohabitans maris TaxID=3071409 RepID=A0ABU0ZDF8_9ACTN|nr:hypothetical protein [Phytohabitans sp. ZYX-F-186]MDQ7904382.1 hypothetical protein [Phytohabitans sp. ZYX-F-186]MDQ7911409.1 hypothetical protein [Phytohabitans sp. ZYX-F-186]
MGSARPIGGRPEAGQECVVRAEAGRTPFGIDMAAGAAAMAAATTVAAVLFPRGDTSGRLLVVAVAAGVYAALAAGTRAALATAGLGYLLFNGFLVHRFGDLSWDGPECGWHLAVIAFATALGLGQRWLRHAQAAGDGREEPVRRGVGHR